jgi:hypothetical protein
LISIVKVFAGRFGAQPKAEYHPKLTALLISPLLRRRPQMFEPLIVQPHERQ